MLRMPVPDFVIKSGKSRRAFYKRSFSGFFYVCLLGEKKLIQNLKISEIKKICIPALLRSNCGCP